MINPKGQAYKGLEMTVRRALAIIQVFDDTPTAKDWSDCEPKHMAAAFGDKRFDPRTVVLPELWARYKDGRLHQQTIELAANLNYEVMSKKTRKEIEDGLARIGKR